MLIKYGLTLDRAAGPEALTSIPAAGIVSSSFSRQRLGSPPSPRIAGFFGRLSKLIAPAKFVTMILIVVVLGALGPQRAAAIVGPPSISLSWGSLGAGIRYYVQTSTNMLTWSAATNTTATNVSLAVTKDKVRTFRVSVSNAPPASATLGWNPSVPSTGVASYAIHYGAHPGNYTNVVNVGLVTSAVISNLVAGTTYYFATTAVSASGMESDFSNETVWQYPLRVKIARLP